MLNSEVLEVGIGMSLLFLLMALVCTAAKEWLEGVLKWRAMDLERALRTLLDDADGSLTSYVYAHPMISSLFQGRYDAGKLTASSMTPGQGAQHMPLRHRRNLPSYIPAGHFAAALLDLVARGPAGADASDAGTPVSMAMLRERIAALDSPHLRRALLSALDHAGNDLNLLRKNVGQWFDGTMDRASGWYRRRTQAVLFMLGMGVAVVLNVDALHVMSRLTTDKAFREAVVKHAETVKAPDAAASNADAARLGVLRDELLNVGMPVGWVGFVPRQLCEKQAAQQRGAPADECRFGARPGQILDVLLGWFITAFAVMLGAPFWFDVLNRIMVIRSTVKPHEKSPEEGSEDRQDKPARVPVPVPVDKGGGDDGNGTPSAPPSPAVAATTVEFKPQQWRAGFDNKDEVRI